jgi:hypothetical protein
VRENVLAGELRRWLAKVDGADILCNHVGAFAHTRSKTCLRQDQELQRDDKKYLIVHEVCVRAVPNRVSAENRTSI